jgi:hypothetical protein
MRIEAYLGISTINVHVLASDYDAANAVRKEVDASRFSKADSDRTVGRYVFRYPLSVDKCYEMRAAWGSALRVHKTLAEWFRVAHQERIEQVARTQDTDATLPRLSAQYPRLNDWLKGDQRVTAAWVANAYRGGGLLADEVGTGKTVGVIAGLVEADITGPTLIVCPKISVRPVWLREITRHTDIPVYACHGARSSREKIILAFLADPHPFKVLVVVSEMLRIRADRSKGRITEFHGYEYPGLFEVEWSAVVVDESHKVLGAMDVVRATLAGEGIRALNYAPNRLKLAVSATPFGKGGRTEALFGTLHWLWPDEFTSRWSWLRKYFRVEEDEVYVKDGGGATKTVRRIGEVINEKGMWADMGPRVLRRTMEEVSEEHKGLKNWIEVMCEMEGAQLAQYKKFTQDAELAVEGGIISTVGTLDYLTRTRQFANGALRKEGGRVVYTGFSCKIDRLLSHLDNLTDGRKVVVASQYNEFLDAVERRLHKEGRHTLRIDGKTTDRQREAAMSAFQGDTHVNRKYQIFLLNTQAGGVSITLDAADELHALDESDPDSMTQLFGRIFRRGRAHAVFFYLYRSMGTIDEKLGHNVADRHEKQARLLDGRRGLEYAKELAQYDKEAV